MMDQLWWVLLGVVIGWNLNTTVRTIAAVAISVRNEG